MTVRSLAAMSVTGMVLAALAAPAGATTVTVAGPSGCLKAASCGGGLARVYGIDIAGAFQPFADADGGIAAIDAGRAQIGVALSTNPALSRRDLVVLKDDRGMIGAGNVVPVLRTRVLRGYGRRAAALRARAALTGALLTDDDVRGFGAFADQRRLAEPIAGEWVEGRGLAAPGRPPRRIPGQRIVLGYQAFDLSEILTRLYALSLRGAGFDVVVRPVGGLRPALDRAYATGRINGHVGFAWALLRAWDPRSTATSVAGVRRALGALAARRGLTTLAFAHAQVRPVFVMHRDVAGGLGIAKLSDLERHLPHAGRPARASAAPGGTPDLRIAAFPGCETSSPFCRRGLAGTYGFDIAGHVVSRPEGLAISRALDDGDAEIGFTFTSDPATRRPDMTVLADDRGLTIPDRYAAFVRASVLRRFPSLRRLIDATSPALTTSALQELRSDRLSGRSATDVAGSFADQAGLTAVSRNAPRGARVRIALLPDSDADHVARVWGVVLAAAGYRVSYVALGSDGRFERYVRAIRSGKVDVVASLTVPALSALDAKADLRHNVQAQLQKQIGRIGVHELHRIPGTIRRVFIMRTALAQQLGVARLSDLARFFPAAR